MVYFISTQVRRYTAETTTLSAELEPGEEKCIIITLKGRGLSFFPWNWPNASIIVNTEPDV